MQNSIDNDTILQALGVTDIGNISRAVIVLQAESPPTITLTRFIVEKGSIYDLEEQFEIKRKDND